MKKLPAKFFCSEGGAEPVKDWLKTLDREDCRIIGSDIKDVEFSFPIGLPLCRSLSGYKNLWEVRSKITGDRIARVIFYISNGEMILLHGFIKKSQKTPKREIDLAVKRQKEHQQHDQ
ncbi:MAG: type II toxin-antitoxin system RelE/ParE family toxin [Leptolyngbyaceae cyanobacterium SU_3_3]|nr:type II toxin-antitoxin system RelE/ParE family toxin [Leptolyngbyaceae cyanobacterium SU_3_3]